MSPTVLRIRGYRLYFFSREERRPHVHVEHASGEAKFWLDPSVALARNYGLTASRSPQPSGSSGSMAMKSVARGKRTSGAEVTNVTPKGFWLRVKGQEWFVSFREFPWFQDASIRQLSAVELPRPHHLYWPELDVDLAVESLEHPEKYPLVSRAQPDQRLKLPGRGGRLKRNGHS